MESDANLVHGRQTPPVLPGTVDAAALMQKQFSPPRWVIQGLLREGLVVLAGRPKIGKSWFLLQLSLAVASGHPLFDMGVEKGCGLYLALEDTQPRLQTCIRQLRGNPPLSPGHLTFATEWPRLDAGGLKKLEAWLTTVDNCRLIIIDTLQKVRPPQKRAPVSTVKITMCWLT